MRWLALLLLVVPLTPGDDLPNPACLVPVPFHCDPPPERD